MDTPPSRTTRGAGLRMLAQRLGQKLRALLAAHRAAQRRRRAWRAMCTLNDATLRDIGLHRTDLTRLLVDQHATVRPTLPRAPAKTQRPREQALLRTMARDVGSSASRCACHQRIMASTSLCP